ncbi:hypothetical protein ES707_13179 [subsurface metagenome]
MEIKDDEKMELDGMEFSEDLLFYGSPLKFGELVKLAGKCIGEVEGSNNIRLIVLETWLFIDFCIRELLMSGLGLNSVNIDTCDLRSQLLPISFSRCIELIEKLKKTHSGLPQDPDVKAIKLPPCFIFFTKKHYPNFLSKLLDIEKEYYSKHVPELVTKKYNPLEVETIPSSVQYSRIPEGWIKAVERIDQDWIKSANRLNNARNQAAHSYDSKKILQRMGYSGTSAVAHLKDECVKLLRNIIGLAKVIEEGEKSPY